MPVKRCPQCGTEYELSDVFCSLDGGRLEEVERNEDPYIGEVIRGCRILSFLGKGAMGAVYLGEHEELQLKRAVKVIHRDFALNESFIERFRVEARAASQIEHPNVIKVFDFGKTADNAFAMVMEYLEGESLADLLKREKRLSPQRAVSIAAEIARGLDAAHELDIIHRDLKPDNVMILKNGRVKVVDFGIAKVVGMGSLTETGNFIGTPLYASPEQASGQKEAVDKRSDIFTLGLMLYEMLSGRLPYNCEGKEWFGILFDRVNGKPLPLSEVIPSREAIPEALSIAVTRAISLDPNVRPTATELVDELEAVLRPVLVVPPAVVVPPKPRTVVPAPLPQTFVNSIGMEFVLVPPGKFLMGSDRNSNEKPVHEVTIGYPFYLGKFPVRQGQWKAVIRPNALQMLVGWKLPIRSIEDYRLPIDSVNWNECQVFLKKLNSKKKDMVYRLPSEAEWEYAYQMGTMGKGATKFDHPSLQLYIWEWCQDQWHNSYHGAPADGSVWEAGSNKERVLRGGTRGKASFIFTDRIGQLPTKSAELMGAWRTGLRVVMIPAKT
jgi:serine/threonine protein kinase